MYLVGPATRNHYTGILKYWKELQCANLHLPKVHYSYCALVLMPSIVSDSSAFKSLFNEPKTLRMEMTQKYLSQYN